MALICGNKFAKTEIPSTVGVYDLFKYAPGLKWGYSKDDDAMTKVATIFEEVPASCQVFTVDSRYGV